MDPALLALLSQQAPPSVQTGKALLLIGLQNDFLTTEGKYPIPVPTDFWPNLQKLVPAFRSYGHVIWVRSQYNSSRGVRDDDDEEDDNDEGVLVRAASDEEESAHSGSVKEDPVEHGGPEHRDSPVPTKRQRVSSDSSGSTPTLDALRRSRTNETSSSMRSKERPESDFFLSSKDGRGPGCTAGSRGAEPSPEAMALVDSTRDIQVTTTQYSAFGSGSLLNTLRSKLVTELFLCGCPTNSSVHATALDAARYGMRITLIDDCLLARTPQLNDMAIDNLYDIVYARVKKSAAALEHLENPPPDDEEDEEGDGDEEYPELSDDEFEHSRDDSYLEADDDEEEEDDTELLAAMTQILRSRQATDLKLSVDLPNGLRGLQFSPPAVPRAFPASSSPQKDDKDSGSTIPGRGKSATQHAADKLQDTQELLRPSEGSVAAHQQNPSATQTDTRYDKNIAGDRDTVQDFWHRSKATLQSSTGESKHLGLNAMAAVVHLDQKAVDQYEDMMRHALSTSPQPLFGADKVEDSAGSTISYNLLPEDLAETVFDRLDHEITWQRMYHQTGEVPRLVCCQGSVTEDGKRPVYRHPSDRTMLVEPWTLTVDEIRKAAEEQVGHPLNHVLIQLYRTGTDYISEHSDKTLDIARGSSIVNASFGAERTMRFRTKRAHASGEIATTATSTTVPAGSARQRTIHRVPMPHNSMIKLTLDMNAAYLHGITADKRPAAELSAAQKAYDGRRISLTFRDIATFVDAESTRIWGQGATAKERETAASVVNGDEGESERLIRAFGAENQAAAVQWDVIYGEGFDVLHLK